MHQINTDSENNMMVGYSDESNWNKGEYRSIAFLSCTKSTATLLHTMLQSEFLDSNISELKWKKLSSAKTRFAATKLIDLVIGFVNQGLLRIDVVVWSISDSRHKIRGRDDSKNLNKMYSNLVKNAISRWSKSAVWTLYPDETTVGEWDQIHVHLESARFRKSNHTSQKHFLSSVEMKQLHVANIIPIKSESSTLIQVTDIFAGMACYSYTDFSRIQNWRSHNSEQLSMFEPDPCDNISNSQRERNIVLNLFLAQCKNSRLGVSFESSNGLYTPNPSNSLNFWFYRPQHIYDKAPTKWSKS